jgi:hypothetical protein
MSETIFSLKNDVDSEKSLLEAIKTANAYELSTPRGGEANSVAEKVRSRLGIGENEVADLAVSTFTIRDESGSGIGERLWVQSATAGSTPNSTSYKYIPVTEVFNGVVYPEDGFIYEEAVAISGMVEGLKIAKEKGALSRLNHLLTGIDDPTTAMMKLPRVNI